MFLRSFFIFVYIFLEFVLIACPQTQAQLLAQHSAAGFLGGYKGPLVTQINDIIYMLLHLMQTCKWAARDCFVLNAWAQNLSLQGTVSKWECMHIVEQVWSLPCEHSRRGYCYRRDVFCGCTWAYLLLSCTSAALGGEFQDSRQCSQSQSKGKDQEHPLEAVWLRGERLGLVC